MKTEVTDKLANSLLVMVLDKDIRAYLEKNDPSALKQALSALADAGYPDA